MILMKARFHQELHQCCITHLADINMNNMVLSENMLQQQAITVAFTVMCYNVGATGKGELKASYHMTYRGK